MSTAELNKRVLQLTEKDRALIKAVEHGLPIVIRPYAEIASKLQTTEQEVITRLQHLIDHGAIKRYGVVVRHKELGYNANGMVVWNIPDDRVDELGMCIGQFTCVTLSYRRPRRLPDWPYNLFTMVHGSNRDQVTKKVEEIIDSCGLQNIEHDILFSTRRFKQRGASYTQKHSAAAKPEHQLNAAQNTASRLHLVK
jgi:siroheme decarboxylase